MNRSYYGVEIVSLLYALKCLHPESIFLLRGNHDFAAMVPYGFEQECKGKYIDAFGNDADYAMNLVYVSKRMSYVMQWLQDRSFQKSLKRSRLRL